MPNEKNKQVVTNLREKIKKAKSIIFADYLGLKSEEMNELRRTIKSEDAELTIAKNTLLKVALEEENVKAAELKTDLQGPTAVVFSYKATISPIKTLFEYAKKLELPRVKSAIIDGEYTDTHKVEVLSQLPSAEELLTRIVCGIKSPISGFTNVLSNAQKSFIYAIKAIAKKKE
jgi:large subunit ribosomal protein L10